MLACHWAKVNADQFYPPNNKNITHGCQTGKGEEIWLEDMRSSLSRYKDCLVVPCYISKTYARPYQENLAHGYEMERVVKIRPKDHLVGA